MSFVTNNNSRRTKRARVQHNRAQNEVITPNPATSFSATVADVKHKHGRNPEIVETAIGSHNSKGLVIHGGMAKRDFNHPYNPDGRDIPLGLRGSDDGLVDGEPNFNLGHPAYPITFSGPGYLEFTGPTSLPSILGPVHVKGDTEIVGDLVVTGTVTSFIAPPVPFNPIITDALGNPLDGVTTTSAYVQEVTNVDHFSARIQWTGKTLIDDAQTMRLTGMPFTTYPEGTSILLQPTLGVYTINVGASLYAKMTTLGNDYFDFYEYSSTSGAAATQMLGSEFASAGELVISGWVEA